MLLNAQIVHLKRQGKEYVTHKPPIESEDLIKLKTSSVIALSNLTCPSSQCVVSPCSFLLSERERRSEAAEENKLQV